MWFRTMEKKPTLPAKYIKLNNSFRRDAVPAPALIIQMRWDGSCLNSISQVNKSRQSVYFTSLTQNRKIGYMFFSELYNSFAITYPSFPVFAGPFPVPPSGNWKQYLFFEERVKYWSDVFFACLHILAGAYISFSRPAVAVLIAVDLGMKWWQSSCGCSSVHRCKGRPICWFL